MLNQFGTSVRNYGLISSGSQEVDTILGGGIRKGTLMEIYGDENARKEIIALGVSKYADKPLLYFNTDGTLDNKNANKYFFFIKKTYQKQKIYAISEILSAKKIISIIKEFDRGILSTIILDSLTTLGLHTAIRLVPLLSIEAKRLDLPIILISHCNILQRPIGYFTTIKYTSQRLEVRYSGPRKKNGKKVGINVLLKCTKSHIIPERRTCKLTLSFLC